MAAGNTRFRLEEIAHQWLALTERRLAYYQELYRSGRWIHYYPTQEHFAARMLDVIRVVKVFREVSAMATARSLQTAATHPRARQNGARSGA